MKHATKVLPALAALTALSLGLPAAAANITYTGVQSFDGATVDLVLTTDGTIGNLVASNFVSFRVTVTDSGGTAVIDNANGSIYEPTCCGQFNTVASPAEIDFRYSDYVGGEFLLFQKGSIGAGGPFYCLSPNGCWTGTPSSYGEEGANSQASSGGGASGALANESAPGPLVIATSVPEPGVWMLLLGGFGGVGTAKRVARRAHANADRRDSSVEIGRPCEA